MPPLPTFSIGDSPLRFGIHATILLAPAVFEWVAEEARQHVDWCGQFGIGVEFEDAAGDVVDTEIEGFASRDWIKFSLACHLLGFEDFTAGFRDNRSSTSTEGNRVLEVVFRPSLRGWLVQQAGGNEISGLVNQLLANARVVDWGLYGKVEELVGEPDCFLRNDRPPDNAIEACERLLGAWDESEETDGQAGAGECRSKAG